MNKKVLLMLVLSSFLLLTLVNAAIPNLGIFKTDDSIELIQSCVINGTFCTSCNISSVDYPNGTRAVKNIVMTKRTGDFNYTLNSTYVTDLGVYKNNGYCKYGSDVIKNWVYYFEVTNTGEKVSGTNTILVAAFLILTIVCLVLGFTFKTDYWLFKAFFYFCALLLSILSINSARIIASESASLSTMTTSGLLIGIVLFAVFMIIIFVYAFIDVIRTLKNKRELRWDY
jgi:lysylphosphatidylglycerol synthetase-like protein (DUF2156 family)